MDVEEHEINEQKLNYKKREILTQTNIQNVSIQKQKLK